MLSKQQISHLLAMRAHVVSLTSSQLILIVLELFLFKECVGAHTHCKGPYEEPVMQ